MAKIQQILEKNEKRIYIDQFIPKECQERNENGDLLVKDYITIKKIPYDIKTKIKYLSMKSFGGQTSKEIIKNAKKKGYKVEDIQNIDPKNTNAIMDFMVDIDFKSLETEEMTKGTLLIEKYILDYGVDSKKHSFKDEKDNPIELDYKTLNNIGNENLLKYIIDNIKDFSQGFILEE